ncbi:hypothetical protein Tco_1162337, partial [Tanacetum coccineum]
MHHDALVRRPIHSGDVIDWEFLNSQELVREFFASFEFDASPCWYDPENLGIRFRLRGKQRGITLLELGWRVGLYTKIKSRENTTLSGLSRAETVKVSHLLAEFWPRIEDGGFNVGKMKVASIRDLKIMDALSVEPLPHVFKKKSLIAIRVVMELHNEACFWPATREVEEDDEAKEVNEGEAGNEGAGGSADMYRDISQGNMKMKPDIESKTINEYLEYEAVKKRQLWDNDDDSEVEQEEDGNDEDTFDMWDITVEDVEQIRNFFNVLDEIDEVVQPLIPEPIHTTPPNDDYVAPATKSILDKLLEEFGDDILNVTMVDEEDDFNRTKDLEELERLLAMRPQSNFTGIQVDRDIISPG